MTQVVKTYLIAVLSLFVGYSAIAQDDVRQQINEIKLNADYQKAEMSDEDETKASEAAILQLLFEVNQSRKERGLDSLLQKHYQPFVKVLSYKRGSRTKSFAYVNLPEIDACSSGIAFSFGSVASVVAVKPTETTIQPVPVSVPVATAPVTVTTNNTPVTPQPNPTVQEPVRTKPAYQLSPTLAKNQLIMYLSEATNGKEVYMALRQFKEQGGIADYGKIASKSELELGRYLVLISFENQVLAVLVPQPDGKYQNLVSQEEDSWTNYHGGGIVWFQF